MLQLKNYSNPSIYSCMNRRPGYAMFDIFVSQQDIYRYSFSGVGGISGKARFCQVFWLFPCDYSQGALCFTPVSLPVQPSVLPTNDHLGGNDLYG